MADIQWWCSATGVQWTWSWRAYPGVWLSALATFYCIRWSSWANAAGALPVWIALDWPIGPLGTGYLASVHAVQFIALGMVAPPLLLAGTSAFWQARLAATRLRRPLLLTLHPVVAGVLFTIMMGATHMPSVVDALMARQLGAMFLDLAWLASGLLFWWPVVVPIHDWFTPPLRMFYLFFGTQAHLLIAMWLLNATFPVYATYELAPRVLPLSALTDQRLAGAVMIALAEPVVLAAISIVFFRWVGEHEQGTGRINGHNPVHI